MKETSGEEVKRKLVFMRKDLMKIHRYLHGFFSETGSHKLIKSFFFSNTNDKKLLSSNL